MPIVQQFQKSMRILMAAMCLGFIGSHMVWAADDGHHADKDSMPHGRKMKDSSEMMARMEKHIERMREMVQKWDAAQTPEARQALMEEHHNMMHEGMEMSPKKGGHSHH